MSGPACTTTYQWPLGGGYFWVIVDLVSAVPCPSAMTGFSAKAMLPRSWQPPMWMCDTCRDVACRPVISTSIVVPVALAVTTIVPVAVTPGSGFSLNGIPAGGLGDCAGLGAGDDVAAVSLPQAAPARTIASVATQARADVTAARHRVPALPQQVTGTPTKSGDFAGPLGAGPGLTPGPRCLDLSSYACFASGADGRRRRQSRNPSPATMMSG